MFPPVLQHVDQSIPDLARGLERPRMVAVGPDSAPAAEDPVHRLGEPDRETLDAPGESAAVGRLHDEVEVIVLHGELQNTETTSRSQYEAAAERAEESAPPQRRPHSLCTQGHVRRVPAQVRRSRSMRHADLASGWLAAGAGASATPRAGPKFELSRARHLIEAIIAASYHAVK